MLCTMMEPGEEEPRSKKMSPGDPERRQRAVLLEEFEAALRRVVGGTSGAGIQSSLFYRLSLRRARRPRLWPIFTYCTV